MNYFRIYYGLPLSGLLHGTIIYFCFFAFNSLSFKMTAPLISPVVTVALTQFLVEQQVSISQESQSVTGGELNVIEELEYANIKVSKQRNQQDNTSNTVAERTPKEVKSEKRSSVKNKAKPEEKTKKESLRDDLQTQRAKEGENTANSLAAGQQGDLAHFSDGENSINAKQRYLDQIKREIDRHKQYPRRARKMRMQGDIQVQFDVTEKGELVNAKVVDSEKSQFFEQAILDAIKRCKPLGKPPENMNRKMILKINFKLD
ncbi:outer membrane transport energization protein TonB [Providencia alcalifaciens]|uniref:Protein TonB n=1 Tax=Providencia alcalifaciens TaxID=126385 RepID=A0A4V2V3V1_9GAMM|nr:energy transducer TonB [Providencia alcalifaciens]TCT35628.1 outer membrane transport energization protein TonB [Providencia alcalifaciens]